MRNPTRHAMEEFEASLWRPTGSRFVAVRDRSAPAPAHTPARLGFLLVVALSFGLIAELIVRIPV